MATCTVSGTLQDVTGAGVIGAIVRASVVTPFFSTTIQIVPYEVNTVSDSSGNWSLNLIQLASAIVTIEFPPNSLDSKLRYTYSVTIPATSTANFSTLATELV